MDMMPSLEASMDLWKGCFCWAKMTDLRRSYLSTKRICFTTNACAFV